ncbi:MAG: hypothetical protein APG10_01540 [Candidatus Methanofastidiosum methylothiophilum]|uniref:Uncharacterized protein n=1 Tax=Candidatus Methanofastidiosum methylothiophilum TaxID=1705564 RepID=A0A150II30_9EURY|nr:MAG: hypothetical protein APG10_01540 [Candidatus Methanofastidiosum methylthiophilus]
MLNQISYYPILGYPLILYLGIIALILFLMAVSISTALKGKIKSHFKIHRRIAIISILIALVHGLMGILAYF